MSFEDILVESGGFGIYQKFLTFGFLTFTLFMVAFTYNTHIFILIIPPHRCNISPNETLFENTFNQSSEYEAEIHHVFQENTTIYNNGIIYDFSQNFPTYASENNLVCENAWKMYMVHTVYWTGSIFGTILLGIYNDKYGRKMSYRLAVTLTTVFDIMTYFCQDYIPFLVTRFFSAVGNVSIGTTTYVLAMEHSIPSKRRLNIFVWSSSYAISSLVFVWISYYISNWEYLLMVSWIPSILTIVISFFIPESPSWLLFKGRKDEAVENIQKMARINGKNLTRDCIMSHLHKSFTSKENGEIKNGVEMENNEIGLYQTLVIFLKSPNLRKRLLFLGILSFVACGSYNGNTLEFQNLPYNIFVTYSIGALVELPGNFVVIFALDVFGRRWINVTCFIVSGILGIMSSNVSNTSLIIVFVMIMKGCYSVAFDITFSYSSELVPTAIRGRALSFIRTCGGIGNILTPFVVSLAEKDPLLPLMCFGGISILAGVLMSTLPETAKQHLPQTIEESENFGKGQSFWSCPFSSSNSEDLKKDSPFGNNKTSEENQVEVIGFKEIVH